MAAVGLVLALAGCGAKAPEAEGPPPPPLPVVEQANLDVATVVDAVDAFGLDLLNSPFLADKGGNLVISPVSVSLVLQMVASGAGGKTAEEMANVLHLPQGATTHARELMRVFGTQDVKAANTVWTQQGLRLKQPFADGLRDDFQAKANDADFKTNPGDAVKRINDTIADQTGGKIKNLFPPGSLDGDTRMVLTNAIYLEAAWAREFKQDKTSQAEFTRPDGSKVQVPMMHNDFDQEDPKSQLGYATGPGFQAVTLPYKSGKLAFTAILTTGPSKADVMRTNGIPAILKQIKPAPVELAMPKFTTSSELDLNDALKDAGMATAFTDQADFSGMTADEPLALQTVRHNTFIQVDEHGTVAAAASGAGARATSAMQTIQVTLDRPFTFVITDTATGAPLFLGRINDPTAKS
ncbi:serpin family protein [Actinocrispum sp. NPDC049592]|uniref:serpin family protein n=1 Tax=Actinocrispum sp. NPDC049592 TaxID=3154835 RepID=UPI003449A3C6